MPLAVSIIFVRTYECITLQVCMETVGGWGGVYVAVILAVNNQKHMHAPKNNNF